MMSVVGIFFFFSFLSDILDKVNKIFFNFFYIEWIYIIIQC